MGEGEGEEQPRFKHYKTVEETKEMFEVIKGTIVQTNTLTEVIELIAGRVGKDLKYFDEWLILIGSLKNKCKDELDLTALEKQLDQRHMNRVLKGQPTTRLYDTLILVQWFKKLFPNTKLVATSGGNNIADALERVIDLTAISFEDLYEFTQRNSDILYTTIYQDYSELTPLLK